MKNWLQFVAPLMLCLPLFMHPAPAGAAPAATEQAKHYICPPCGLPCDSVVFDKPGICPKCGMDLVDADKLPAASPTHSKVAILLFDGVEIIDYSGPFEVYMKANVWGPARMTRTSFDVPGRTDSNRARSYRIDRKPPAPIPVYDLTYKFASGGMLSTAEDLVRLAVALDHGLLLKPETVNAMFTPQTGPALWFREGTPPGRERFKQALMWRVIKNPAGQTMVYECGSVNGFNACLVIFPEDDLVAAIATNSWGEAGGWKQAVAFADFFRKPRRP